MAFRGAIAFSKGLKLTKEREEKKKNLVKKWENSYKKQVSSKADRRDNSLNLEPARHHTHEGLIRLQRAKTLNGAGTII